MPHHADLVGLHACCWCFALEAGIAAIILPLSLLAGIYGMNFLNMPELSWEWGYFGLLGLMALLAIGQWVYFARRGFIGPPPTRALGKGLASLSRLPISSTRVNSERKSGDSS